MTSHALAWARVDHVIAESMAITKPTTADDAEHNNGNIEPRDTMLSLNDQGISCLIGAKIIKQLEI